MLSPHIGQSFPGIDFSSSGPYRTRSLMREGTYRRFGGEPVAVMTRDDSRHEANCFADEINIDFPSVAPAIERIRRSFLADERPETLRAAVELTGQEAAHGVTLPFNVPVHCTCVDCGGRGESWSETCARCRGCGFDVLRHAVQVTIPAGVRDGARFCFTVTQRPNRSTRVELCVVVAAAR
jgi:hypothetical protein